MPIASPKEWPAAMACTKYIFRYMVVEKTLEIRRITEEDSWAGSFGFGYDAPSRITAPPLSATLRN
jgi:hypothetical protein